MNDAIAATTPQWGTLITGLGGGLALFLFGMRMMTESLKTVSGSGMKNVLAKLTANRFSAAVAGTIVTGVIQSSSATTVLIVGFISAGLMNLQQSVGVIIGANIGTTVTSQIIAFKIYQYGLLMIATGYLVELLAKRERIRQWGMVVMGLGLLFFGMELMSQATVPLRAWPLFIEVMQDLRYPMLGILAGAIFTAIVQSSSATTGIVIVLASQGLITLESGIGLIFGANIGTCVTAVISSWGRPREAAQAACVHVVFNAGGVLLWMFFIPQLAQLIRAISPSEYELQGVARLAADTPRQIANAHTLFNIGNALLFIWFTGPLAKFAERIVPIRPTAEVGIRPKFLDEMFLEQPSMALDQVRRELARLAGVAQSMLVRTLDVIASGKRKDVEDLLKIDNDIDALHGGIVMYLGRLSQKNLVDPQPNQLYLYIAVANYLENFGDVIEKNLSDDAERRIQHRITISAATMRLIQPLHQKVCWSFERMLAALENGDLDAALEVTESKADVNKLADEVTAHLAKRLVASEPHRLEAFQIETDIIENLKRLHTLTRRIARTVIDLGPVKAEQMAAVPSSSET